MPAIDLSRLRIQVARLGENYNNQSGFVRELHELLEFYTNRTKRSSQIAQRIDLPSYHTPGPVLRKIERELVPRINQFPAQGVLLAKELWKNGSLEYRLIAARITGMLPPTDAMPLLTHIPEWLTQTTNKVLHRSLLTDGLSRLRTENPSAFFSLVEDWLKSSRVSYQTWGLQALLPELREPDFQNLPAVFRILRPAVLRISPATQLDIQAVLCALETISLTETTIFLRELLENNLPASFFTVFRRMLPAFSSELQSSLRMKLRDIQT